MRWCCCWCWCCCSSSPSRAAAADRAPALQRVSLPSTSAPLCIPSATTLPFWALHRIRPKVSDRIGRSSWLLLSIGIGIKRSTSKLLLSIDWYRYQAFDFKAKLLSIDSVSSRLTSKLLLSIDLAGIRTFEKECEPEDLDPNSYSDDSENEIADLMTRSNFYMYAFLSWIDKILFSPVAINIFVNT